MSYKIGSFNLYKFSYQSDEEIKKDIDNIANIIRGSKNENDGFDIVALQEVLSESAYKQLLERLNKTTISMIGGNAWEGCWERPPKTISDMAAEGFAFLWRRDKFHLTDNFSPRIIDQYKVDKEKNQSCLLRNPYFIRLTPHILPKVEIRLINVHFRFAKGKEDSISANLMRKNEFNVLTSAVLPKYEDKIYKNERDESSNMVKYTIMLGDYNLNINRSFNKSPYLEEVVEIKDRGVVEKIIVTVQDEKTTLKQKVDGDISTGSDSLDEQVASATDQSTRGYANNYDHFSFNKALYDRAKINVKRVDAVRQYYDDDFDKYRQEVSDHIPVKMTIDFK